MKQVGGQKYSCVCLHGDRKPQERKGNLEKFKAQQVKFLICTDVAARGIDITGLPFSECFLLLLVLRLREALFLPYTTNTASVSVPRDYIKNFRNVLLKHFLSKAGESLNNQTNRSY